jgi:Kef-type K+ transport system membrane component KefB
MPTPTPPALPLPDLLAWPAALFVAWLLGEAAYRRLGLPRVTVWAVVGFVLAAPPLSLLPASDGALLLANIAFGLVLFEFGHRINLGWFAHNRTLAISGVLESTATFVVVAFAARAFGMSLTHALLVASLSMATSPAGVLRVVNELRSAGQVTERVLHLAAINCVLAVAAYKTVLAFSVFQTSGSALAAVSSSLLVVAGSVAAGLAFGVLVPWLLRTVPERGADGTLAFAIAVVALAALTHGLKLSPVVATLTFGLAVRWRRIVLGPAQRGFGSLGDLLSVLLFVYVASTLDAQRVAAGLGLGALLVLLRLFVKTAVVALFARASGTSWTKGALTGAALAPMSAFVVLVLEQTRHGGVDLLEVLAPLAAATLLLEAIGPVITQRALLAAKEATPPRLVPGEEARR